MHGQKLEVVFSLPVGTQLDVSNLLLYSEHNKKGSTNPSNLPKHQKGQARKHRDNRGEKGDARRKPNPNKRPPSEYSIGEKITSGFALFGSALVFGVLLVDDITGIGTADDALMFPMTGIMWDSAAKLFS